MQLDPVALAESITFLPVPAGTLERVMNLAKNPHPDADNSVSSVPCGFPIFPH